MSFRKRPLATAAGILGPRRCRSIAACGISTNCALTFIATATPISKRSRPAFTTCAPRPIRAAGRPATTFRPCAMDASSRTRSRTVCPSSPRISSSTPGGRSSPTSACARRSRCCSTSSGSTAIFSSISIGAARASSTIRELSAYRRPADATRARAAGALSRRGARRRARRHLVAAGQRRLGPRSREPAPGAGVARRRRLRAQRHDVARARQRARVQLRDHGDEPRR